MVIEQRSAMRVGNISICPCSPISVVASKAFPKIPALVELGTRGVLDGAALASSFCVSFRWQTPAKGAFNPGKGRHELAGLTTTCRENVSDFGRLWIRRVLVRSQAGQLQASHAVSLALLCLSKGCSRCLVWVFVCGRACSFSL